MRITTYGPGGYDPKARNNNIVAEIDVPDVPDTSTPTVDEKLDALTAAIKASASIADLKARIVADPTLDPAVDVVPVKG